MKKTFIIFIILGFIINLNAKISSKYFPNIKMIYIVPSDKTYNKKYELAITNAIKNLQNYFFKELGNNKTFFLNPTVVEVIHSQMSSSEFSLNMWNLATFEVMDYYDADWNDNNRWIIYVDADSDCKGEVIGGTSGFAVLDVNDLRGLIKQKQIYHCENNKNTPQYMTPSRWIGGLGHELGHALLLSHPPQCEPKQTKECPKNTLMYLGYIKYPNTFLLEKDKEILNNSKFFTTKPSIDALYNYFEKILPTNFKKHIRSRYKKGVYFRSYKNGALLSVKNDILTFKLSEKSKTYILSLNNNIKEYVDILN